VAERRQTETNWKFLLLLSGPMKTQVNMRLRPMRAIALFGIVTMAAMPVSVARAGTEDPMAAALEAELALATVPATAIDNAGSADTVPEMAEPEAAEPEIAELLGTGEASWYGPKFAGRRTASGETFDPTELTAAHRTLPFGSLVRVTSSRTGKSVVVRINDRGPYHGNRVIDLSEAAAKEIGIKSRGRGNVDLALLEG
jgi:rare lipoprotein A